MDKLAKLVYDRFIYQKEYKFYSDFLEYVDFSKIENFLPANIKNITFIMPAMIPYSEKQASVLKLGTNLDNLGYSVNYVSYMPQNIKHMQEYAKTNLSDFKGNIYDKSYLYKLKSDVNIATVWESAYYVKRMSGYRMYLVQDYEPYSYTYGEIYLLAQKSYELGLHITSLGRWNKYVIEKYCGSEVKVDYIDFPYEGSGNKPVKRNFVEYKDKREFNIAVYMECTANRAPISIQKMMSNIIEEFALKGIKINVFYFGEDKSLKLHHGINLGKLGKNEILELYNKCDFGMVSSLTNISSIPYDMIETSLPVIEFCDGTFNYFFAKDEAIMITLDWRDLFDKLNYSINVPESLQIMTEKAFKRLTHLNWEKTAGQFDNILKNICYKSSDNVIEEDQQQEVLA